MLSNPQNLLDFRILMNIVLHNNYYTCVQQHCQGRAWQGPDPIICLLKKIRIL